MASTAQKPVISLKEAADYLGTSPSNLYKLARTGEVPAFKLGSLWKFKMSELDKFTSGVIPSASTSASGANYANGSSL